MSKYEQLIEYIINEDEDKARELFHSIVVEKSREIYESLIDEEDLEEVGGDQVADMVDEITSDEQGMAEAEDDEMEMDDEEEVDMDMDDEGGDLEGAMDAPVGDDEDMGVEVEDDELMGEEEIVQEVARRVAARLIREKKQDATASKLAERIFRRLASK